jgi:hypothetical protein
MNADEHFVFIGVHLRSSAATCIFLVRATIGFA